MGKKKIKIKRETLEKQKRLPRGSKNSRLIRDLREKIRKRKNKRVNNEWGNKKNDLIWIMENANKEILFICQQFSNWENKMAVKEDLVFVKLGKQNGCQGKVKRKMDERF